MIRTVEALVRAWTPRKGSGGGSRSYPAPREFLAFDTETTTDTLLNLLIGVCRIGAIEEDGGGAPRLVTLMEILFHADDLPPEAVRTLRRYVATHRADAADRLDASPDLCLMSASEFIDGPFYAVAAGRGALVIGFNLPFDLSRLARDWAPTDEGGFRLRLFSYTDKRGRRRPDAAKPDIGVKHLDPRKSLIAFLSAKPGAGRKSAKRGTGRRDADPSRFLDLRSAGFALTNGSHTLELACEAFGVHVEALDYKSRGEGPYHKRRVKLGVVSGRLVTYCREDVSATVALAERVLNEHRALGIERPVQKLLSPASDTKDLLTRFGVRPALSKTWDLPPTGLSRDDYLGLIFTTFFGGRSECRNRRERVPGTLTDIRSEYPAVSALMGLWRYSIADSYRVRDSECEPALRDEVQSLLDIADLGTVLDPATWRHPAVRSFTLVDPAGCVLPIRARYDEQNPGIAFAEVVSCIRPLWLAVPDIVASNLLGGARPRILRTIAAEPVGVQEGLKRLRLPDGSIIDPRTDDPYVALVEARERLRSSADLSPEDRERWYLFLKVVTNSLYGISAEMIREHGEAEVSVFGLSAFCTKVRGPERPGQYVNPVVAALTTAGGHLMLATIERAIRDRGAAPVFMDTDSAFIPVTKDGGPVPCEGGPERTDDGRPAIRTLTPVQVGEVIADLDRLNPYDPAVVPHLLKVEHEGVTAFPVSSKRYVLRYPDGRIVEDEARAHGLGHLMDPRTPEEERAGDRFVREVWEYVEALDRKSRTEGPEPDPPSWADYPAVQKVAATTPDILRSLDPASLDPRRRRRGRKMRPFNFALAPIVEPSYGDRCKDDEPHRLVGPFEHDPAKWTKLPYTCVRCRRRFRISTRDPFAGPPEPGAIPVQTLGRYARAYIGHPEFKADDVSGRPCDGFTRGVLRRPQVEVAGVSHIGKEGNRAEARGAGIDLDPFEEAVHDYGSGGAVVPRLILYREAARALGARIAAEASGVPVRTVRDFLAGRTPRGETMRALERGITEAARRTPDPDGFLFASGGAYTGAYTGEGQFVYVPPDEAVRAFVGWDRSRQAHEAWAASLSCPACGGEAGPLHVCPEPALRACACGCGTALRVGARPDARYVSDAHRKRAVRARVATDSTKEHAEESESPLKA